MADRTCSVDGCVNSTKCRGWCGKHYNRVKRYGSPDVVHRLVGATDEERFWSKVEKTDDCWQWTASTMGGRYPYGWFSKSGVKSVGHAHRFSYELHNGPIPEGLVVDHLCRNPRCVRPDHLEAVTWRENLDRGDPSQADKNVVKTHCKRGHEFSEENTRMQRGTRQCRICDKIRKQKWMAKRNGSPN